jgi:tetratricopeptide (TPR) repeat protein
MIKNVLILAVLLCAVSYQTAFAQQEDALREVSSLIQSCAYDQAAQLAAEKLTVYPDNTQLMLLQGKALAYAYRFDRALYVLEKAHSLDTTDIRIITELLNVCQSAGESEKFIDHAHQAIRLYPDNRRFRLQLEQHYAARNDFRAALSVIQPLHTSDTNDLYVLEQMATIYFELKSNDTASMLLKRMLVIAPQNSFAVKKLANVYIRQKAYAEGLQLTESFLATDSVNIPVLKLKGFFLYQLKDYAGAKTVFTRCFDRGDKSAFSYKYRGLCSYSTGDFGEALDDFDRSWLADSSDAETLFYKGVCEARWVFQLQGIQDMNKSLKMIMPAPSFLSVIYIELAEAHNFLGKSDTALALMKKAYETYPENKGTLFRIAYQYDYHLNDQENALVYYTTFLESGYRKRLEIQSGTINVSYEEYARNRIEELKKP